jgi:hypothetical protein
VRVEDGRPVRLTTDRHGLTGGPIVQAAGPWRTSGEWWAGEPEEHRREPEEQRREWEGHSRERKEQHREWVAPPESRENATPESRESSYSRQGRSSLPDVATRLPTRSAAWDRDEWDIAMGDGTVYRLFVEREVGQWFLEGVFD